MRTILRAVLAAALGTVLLGTAACGGGGDGGGRPSTDEIAKTLKSKASDNPFASIVDKLDAKTADCIADKLHSSKISDKALRALVKGDTDFEGSASDQKAAAELVPSLTSCTK
jgi:hypothetical protein